MQDKKLLEKVVFVISKDGECSKCKAEIPRKGFLYKDKDQGLCMNCSGFGDFVFLHSGNAKLTLRAKKNSPDYAIVIKFSKSRKRYERQGILVTEAAFKMAEASIEEKEK